MTSSKVIVALGGEGIGPEVIDATCELMVKAGMPVEITTPPHGESAIKSHGHGMPEPTKQACERADGVLFGAAGGAPTSAVVGWLRWEMGTYASVRPVKHYPGAASPLAPPNGID
jgi:isocitrate/isopropylmalate dehydrogenase